MDILQVSAAALLCLVAAAYAQYRIPRHTDTPTKALLARVLLIVIGAAFGGTTAINFAHVVDIPPALVFLTAFGLVHVPAALILFIKGQGGAGKS